MENQYRKIAGYRVLSQEEIDLMNDIKSLGPHMESVINRVRSHVATQRADATPEDDERLDAANPEQWVEWGSSSMQAALMYLTRAVAQPTFF